MTDRIKKWALIREPHGCWSVDSFHATKSDAVFEAQCFMDTQDRPKKSGSGYLLGMFMAIKVSDMPLEGYAE